MRDTYQMAVTLLNSVVATFAAATPPVTLPSVQYVAPGRIVAYDGEQVTVNINRVFAGRPGAEDAFDEGSFIVMSVELQVTIVRYTPGLADGGDGDPIVPDPADIQSNAQAMLTDVTTLTQALVNVQTQSVLGSRAMPSTIGPVTTEGPEGGVVATVGLFTTPLL